jgi:hypothetical protein
MEMKRKGCFLVTVIVGLFLAGCTSTPKLYVVKSTSGNHPDAGTIHMQTLPFFIDGNNHVYSFIKGTTAKTGDFINYQIRRDATGNKKGIAAAKETNARMAASCLSPLKTNFVEDGPFKLIADGVTFFSSEDVMLNSISNVVVDLKTANLGADVVNALRSCSLLVIDGNAIPTEGINAINIFLKEAD